MVLNKDLIQMIKNEKIWVFTLLFCLLAISCTRPDVEPCNDYRQAMRDFVIRISETARAQDPNFIIIPQNGIELVTLGKQATDELAISYLDAIDGHGQEDLFYGYVQDNQPTPAEETERFLSYLRRSHQAGKTVLVTDYCTRPEYAANALDRCTADGFVSFVAPHRELDIIPTANPPHENAQDVWRLSDVHNFLYLINPENFDTRADFVEAVSQTNYDLIIMDLFFNDGSAFTSDEIELLKRKSNGGRRLVICYMSIGEAEDYRYYWQSDWNHHKPAWLSKRNPHWAGNYKVRYWHSEWQNIICGPDDSYLNRILTAGFDGVYLDIIDAFEYFE